MIYGYYIYFEDINECDMSDCDIVERDLFKTPQKNLNKIIKQLTSDDVVIVPCLARLGNVNFLYNVIKPIFDKGARIYLNDEAVYLDDNFLAHLKILNTTYKHFIYLTRRAGIHRAKKEGKYKVCGQNLAKRGFNPNPKIEINDDFKTLYDMWKNKDITAQECMRRLGWKPDTFYRRVKEYEGRE